MAEPPRGRSQSTGSRTSTTTSTARFQTFLRKMAEEGVSQQEVARRTGIAAQHVSDLKKGRRRVGELIARRLEEQFGISHRWFLGRDPAEEPLPTSVTVPGAWAGTSSHRAEAAPTVRVPVHSEPVEGDPHDPACWGGSLVELTGPAAVAAGRADRSYVLRLPADGRQGRLRQGDMLLIVQEFDQTSIGDLGVIRSGESLLLAWRSSAHDWVALATGEPVESEGDLGHCVGLVWARLEARWPAPPDEPLKPSSPIPWPPGKRRPYLKGLRKRRGRA